tara:strand:- start:2916 stop:3326 length:411 start_codon:yes stop_codon:yes gene_type:complete
MEEQKLIDIITEYMVTGELEKLSLLSVSDLEWIIGYLRERATIYENFVLGKTYTITERQQPIPFADLEPNGYDENYLNWLYEEVEVLRSIISDLKDRSEDLTLKKLYSLKQQRMVRLACLSSIVSSAISYSMSKVN